ncbi:MAG: hypothetical protein U9Q15_04795 [Patescibacteria group bacterium]|nr:hypothetical protein [Patescibacteria group bacterium]
MHQAGDEQDLANKIEGLISNLAQANTLRNNALKTVEIYDQQTIIDTYISTLS